MSGFVISSARTSYRRCPVDLRFIGLPMSLQVRALSGPSGSQFPIFFFGYRERRFPAFVGPSCQETHTGLHCRREPMVTDTQELIVFHAVVKHASYAKAAEELGLSASGVSRIVTRIEERLGVRLVQRTTRKLCLTEAGSAFHARTSQILLDLAEAEAEIQETSCGPAARSR